MIDEIEKYNIELKYYNACKEQSLIDENFVEAEKFQKKQEQTQWKLDKINIIQKETKFLFKQLQEINLLSNINILSLENIQLQMQLEFKQSVFKVFLDHENSQFLLYFSIVSIEKQQQQVSKIDQDHSENRSKSINITTTIGVQAFNNLNETINKIEELVTKYFDLECIKMIVGEILPKWAFLDVIYLDVSVKQDLYKILEKIVREKEHIPVSKNELILIGTWFTYNLESSLPDISVS